MVAVAGHPTDRSTFYFGACAGGVWKTTDGGTLLGQRLRRLLRRPRPSARCAVAPSDAQRDLRRHGRGVHPRQRVPRRRRLPVRPTAAAPGRNLGLRDTRHIGRVRVDPRDPDTVYVAALGHAWGPNRERGVLRSRDGGRTWQHVAVPERAGGRGRSHAGPAEPARALRGGVAGAADAVGMSERRPAVIAVEVDRRRRYAGPTSRATRPAARRARAHRRRRSRRPTAGASTRWSRPRTARCSARTTPAPPGSAAASRPACADVPGTTCTSSPIRVDVDTVWVADYSLWKSIDGGKTFVEVATPHGDNHDLWIDPGQPAADDRGQRRRRLRVVQRRRSRGRRSTTSRPRSSTTCAPTTSGPTGSTAPSRTTGRSACRASRTGARSRPSSGSSPAAARAATSR